MGARVTARRRPQTPPLTLEAAVLAAVDELAAKEIVAFCQAQLADHYQGDLRL